MKKKYLEKYNLIEKNKEWLKPEQVFTLQLIVAWQEYYDDTGQIPDFDKTFDIFLNT